MPIKSYVDAIAHIQMAARGSFKDIATLLRSMIDGETAGPVTITADAAVTLGKAHRGRTVVAAKADGITFTLPAATGSGDRYLVYVKTTITSSNLVIQVANATDIIQGVLPQSQDSGATIQAWEAGASDDTITMNGSTKGGIKGDFVELIDVAAGEWGVRGTIAGTGVEATPFSAAVS